MVRSYARGCIVPACFVAISLCLAISDWGDPEMVFLGNEPKKHATRDADGRQTDLTTIKFGISTSVQKAVRRN